eukprot:CAMPEP_0197671516 /NCGR_PEP_ID=MMETSP1338-20131121/76848_1 /TAXON_ID=43686 ORGANISM="Pelagodinium beii, Strain RCC1491" /NCGR_SAMPLE_ID=MMETSP1338 /ASSEMBLY_ACC=CAM_ASM_000754 /LENGTH=58 /DNA_ID=CAMNT_0043251435 /DNA_START=86 /DNA_END=259 /DNA_ORIENTATION=+
MTEERGTDAMVFPMPSRMALKSAWVITPFASMPSMALTWALAASWSAAESILVPMTII